MKKQLVKFVINKNLDIRNHLIGLETHKNKTHSFTRRKNEKLDALLKLSKSKQKISIAKDVAKYYFPAKRKFLDSIVTDINREWLKIEKDFLTKLEKIHKKPFPYNSMRGVISSADRFGYSTNGHWFAIGMRQNKFIAIDIATHELMHFMFHKYYWKTCSDKGLSEKQIWDIKEAFTVLLNLEFSDIRFEPDYGYPEHKNIREAIEKSWKKNSDFGKTLESAIKAVAKK